ncbi:MAG TPA: CHASE2 domain-containing protein [Vicinamibacterales bacterium]|nr:CHASE2 domain-containing protein [Vicinamibacterales bacterium]
MTSRRVFAHGVAVTLAATALAAVSPASLTTIDLKIYDAMFRAASTRPPSGRVAIVAIDDRSLAEIGQWPWSRDVIARLVEGVRALGASVVAVDLLLAEPDRFASGGSSRQSDTDAALADTLRKGGVVMTYAFTFDADGGGERCVIHPADVASLAPAGQPSPFEQLFRARGVVCSLPALNRAAGASGYLNAGPDRDGILRRLPLLIAFNENVYPSLALTAVGSALGVRHLALTRLPGERARLMIGERFVPLDERGSLVVRFRGPRGTFPHVSAADVLNGRTPPDALNERIVFVGATALGVRDVTPTPVETAMPGIEVHASAADTLLQEDFISTPSYWRAYEIAATLVFGLTATALVAVAGHMYGAALAALLLPLLWRATAQGVDSAGIFLSPMYPMLAVVSALAVVVVAGVRFERRRAEHEQERRQRAHHFAVQSLTSLMETRDGATGLHARRTQAYSRLLAARLARVPYFAAYLTPERIELISRLSPLHDIGKVGVRDAVLNKPGALSGDEREEIERHPEFGHEAIARAERLAGPGAGDDVLVQVAKDVVYTHHERWDGRGYPRGLTGREIPIAGRIVAVVDVYDALTTTRIYRGRVPHDEAVAAIAAGRGTQFDPDVVDAFLELHEQFRALAEEPTDEPVTSSPNPLIPKSPNPKITKSPDQPF